LFRGTLVAELSKEKKEGRNIYTFRYLPTFKELRLAPLPGIPYSEAPQPSPELWPFFSERIPDSRRPEIDAWMRRKKLSEADDIRMLAELSAHSVTDPYEIRLVAA
jgi:hypothetical protein